MQERIIQTIILAALSLSIWAGRALCKDSACFAPPDQRTWDEAFAAICATNVHHRGERDAARLKQIDYTRTQELLVGWLSKDQPDHLRRRAVLCLGYNAFRETIPQIETVVRDKTEALELRHLALNIGLRYMREPRALDIAKDFAGHKTSPLRLAAYWVLSDYGNEEARSVLRAALRTDRQLWNELVYALYESGDPEAGKVVYDTIPEQALVDNPELAWRYALVMKEHHITSAAPVVARFVDSQDSMTRRYATNYFTQNPSVLTMHTIASNQVVVAAVEKHADNLQQQIEQIDRRLAEVIKQQQRLKRTPMNEEERDQLEIEQQEWLAMESHRNERIARDAIKRNTLSSELHRLTAALHAAKQIQDK